MNDILTISLYLFNNIYKKERTFGRFFLDEKSIFIYNSTKSYYYIERRQR